MGTRVLKLEGVSYLMGAADLVCSECGGPHGEWAVQGAGTRRNMCPSCVLYETSWGRENEAAIAEFAKEVEAYTGKPLERLENGRLTLQESNRLVAALYTTHRMVGGMTKFVGGSR